MISFTVYGRPVPQGSMRAFLPKGSNRPIVTSDNKKLKPWRQQVSETAMYEMRKAGISVCQSGVALCVIATFYFAKPKSVKKCVTQKTTKPDVDKLLRGVLDALTGVVFWDDSQVVIASSTKLFGVNERLEVEVRIIPQ